MKRYTKAERIKDLIAVLNEKRKSQGLPVVSREWTGAGHWLKVPMKGGDYSSLGDIYTNDERFIGFLEGLIYPYGHT